MISDEQRRSIIDAAIAVRERAFCPHSGYAVGAALLDSSGNIHVGANVENISYGLTICAERAAVCAAVASGAEEYGAIAVATKNRGTPCGACRQVLAEFRDRCGVDLIVYLVRASNPDDFVETTLDELLPQRFSAADDWGGGGADAGS